MKQEIFSKSESLVLSLSKEIEAELISKLEATAPKVNGIVVSDFVYGVVTDKVLEVISRVSEENNLLLFGDLQCSSQVGTVTRFQNFSLLCPNEREARIALKDKDDGTEGVEKFEVFKENYTIEKILLLESTCTICGL